MRLYSRLIVATMAALLAACGADVGEAGTRLSVDSELVTGEVLYVLPDVSEVPFTARELEQLGIHEAEAIPVRVEILEDIAVAWFAPDGEARIGRDWIVALWRVHRAPLQGELAGASAPPVNQPGLVQDDAAIGGLGDGFEPRDIELLHPDLVGAPESVIIEFWDRLGTPEELSMLEELYAHHPGC